MTSYLLGVLTGLGLAAVALLTPWLWALLRAEHSEKPLSDWSSGRRRVPEGRGQPAWLDDQGRRDLHCGRP